MQHNQEGILGIAQGADPEDALFTNLDEVAEVPKAHEDLMDILAEGLAEVPEEDVSTGAEGLFDVVDPYDPKEGEAVEGMAGDSANLARSMAALASRAPEEPEAELGMLQIAGELDARGLMSPNGWVRMDGQPFVAASSREAGENLKGLFLEGVQHLSEGDAPWGYEELDDIDTDAGVFAAAVAQVGFQPDANVVGGAVRDLRIAGYDVSGWEGLLPSRGVFGLCLVEAAREEMEGEPLVLDSFMDREEGEDDSDLTSFSSVFGEVEDPEEVAVEGDDADVQYVRDNEEDMIGTIIEFDEGDSSESVRVQWEDGETGWINPDEERYEIF